MRPEQGSKPLPRSNAQKQRAARLRKQKNERPFRVLHQACRECGRPIKPSYVRQFCPGGKCRTAFFKKVQVTTWVEVKSGVQQ